MKKIDKMKQMDRIHKIDQMLGTRKKVSKQDLLGELGGISWSTLKRDLTYMRDALNAPISFDREIGSYRFDQPNAIGPEYKLPGIWFNSDEAYALLLMHQLLSDLEPGILAAHVASLKARLEAIVKQGGKDFSKVADRIRIIGTGKRSRSPNQFSAVSHALLDRRRIRVLHYSRENNERTERVLSPQRLVFYRNNWYLETWCHLRGALRRFSVDAFEQLEILKDTASEVATSKLNVAFASGYGIYGNTSVKKARLLFSEAAARWVADEMWHPEQVGKMQKDGRYLLVVPYTNPTELLMDILRHGRNVEVLAPQKLRDLLVSETTLIKATHQA